MCFYQECFLTRVLPDKGAAYVLEARRFRSSGRRAKGEAPGLLAKRASR